MAPDSKERKLDGDWFEAVAKGLFVVVVVVNSGDCDPSPSSPSVLAIVKEDDCIDGDDNDGLCFIVNIGGLLVSFVMNTTETG